MKKIFGQHFQIYNKYSIGEKKMKKPAFILKIENSIQNVQKYKNDLLKNKEQVEGWKGWLQNHKWDDLVDWLSSQTANETEKYILMERTKLFYNKWENYDFEAKINELDNELEKLSFAYKKAQIRYREWQITQEFS